jgi:hypothetical protein
MCRESKKYSQKRLPLIFLAQFLIFNGSSQAWAGDIATVSADDFLNSLGVNVHADHGVLGATYIEPLRYLGVRYIRDGERNSSRILLIHRQTGVRLDLLTCEGDPRFALSIGRTMAASGALLSFEGPNEPSNFPIIYNGQSGGGTGSWAPVALFQEDLYRAVKSDAGLRNYPVFAVSAVGTAPTQTLSNFSSVTLTLNDHALIVEVKP